MHWNKTGGSWVNNGLEWLRISTQNGITGQLLSGQIFKSINGRVWSGNVDSYTYFFTFCKKFSPSLGKGPGHLKLLQFRHWIELSHKLFIPWFLVAEEVGNSMQHKNTHNLSFRDVRLYQIKQGIKRSKRGLFVYTVAVRSDFHTFEDRTRCHKAVPRHTH